MNRCVNIDWLEVHVLEDVNLYPLDAYYFTRAGYYVKQREYGTRVYDQMFTICDEHDEPFLEIRRAPKSATDEHGVLDPHSAHIRLANRYCYHRNCVQLLRDFLARHNYTFRRIFRLDICLDFERFDRGDDPARFLKRYIRHKFTKINQCNRVVHGTDRWDGCDDNYISWGAKTSMVSTKFYNKTKELEEAKKKPYIIQSWVASGLLTNPLTMIKVKKDGTQYKPTIWRVEFSIKSGNSGWAVLEDCNGNKNRTITVKHTLDAYDSDKKLLLAFASLAHHYFHFKYYQNGVRKDRCQDKVLFDFNLNQDAIYRLTRVAQSTPQSTEDARLHRALQRYAEHHIDPTIRKACEVILNSLDRSHLMTFATDRWDYRQVEELQAILSRRMELPEEDFVTCVDAVRRLLQNCSDTPTW